MTFIRTTTRCTTWLALFGALALGGCVTRGAAQGVAAQRPQTEAVQAAETLVKPEMNDRETYGRLIQQMQQKGLFFASLAHIDAFEQRWGVTPESSLMRADALRQTGQQDNAKTLYTQLLGTAVKGRAAHGLGLLAGRSGDLAGAAGYLTQANLAMPTNAAVLNDLGFVLLQQGKLAEARIPLMKASELDGENPKVWSNVALYLTLSHQAEQARQVMEGQKLSPAVRAQITELAARMQRPEAAPAPTTVQAAPEVLEPAAASAKAVESPEPVPVAARPTPVVMRDIGAAELSRLP